MRFSGWGSNTANKLETIDIYGNRAEFNNYAPNEPNNKYGDPSAERGEDCVKMVSSSCYDKLHPLINSMSV